MHYTQVRINRDEMTGLVIHVGAWEIPILEAKHGEAKLEVGELKEFKGREWPTDPRSEMQRLNTLYGGTGSADNAPSFAEMVYGRGPVGVKALAAAIEDARKAAEPKKRRAATAALVGDAAAG